MERFRLAALVTKDQTAAPKGADMARKKKARKAKGKRKPARKAKKRAKKTAKKAKRKVARSKRKTTVSVKSGKAAATLNMQGVKPTGATVSYGETGQPEAKS
jgi:microsomal dipeptidase-like Zn-dependent dipeptidase